MSTTRFQVSGMSCGHCEASIREELAGVAGVESVEVSAATGRLDVTANAPLDPAAVLAAVVEAGYEAVPA